MATKQVSFFGPNNPEILSQQRQIAMREALAAQLMKQGGEESQTEFAGGLAVKQPAAQGVNKALQQGLSAYMSMKDGQDSDKLATDTYNNQAAQFGAPQYAPGNDSLANALDPVNPSDPSSPQPQGPVQGGPLTIPGMNPTLAMTMANDPNAAKSYYDTLLAQYKPTDMMLNNKYMGITPPQAKTIATAGLGKDLATGTTVFDDNGKPSIVPTPGATDVAAGNTSATKEGENIADADKTAKIMQSNLPMVLNRFEDMRQASEKAGYGTGNNNEGTGFLQQYHKNFPDSETGKANAVLAQRSAQGILPELGPQLAQAGIKGNKFLETIASNASGLDLSAAPPAKKEIIDGLEKTYVGNLKSTNAQLRAHGKPAMSDTEVDAAVKQYKSQYGKQTPASDPLPQARDAIAKGAPRDAVIQRLQQSGINPAGL